MRVIYCFLIISITFKCEAQTLFANKYLLSGNSALYSVTPNFADSTYILGGYRIVPDTTPLSKILTTIAKTDSVSNLQWFKEYEFNVSFPPARPFFIYPFINDNKLLFSGSSIGNDSIGISHVVPFMGLIDTAGQIITLKEVTLSPFNDFLNTGIKTLDGGYIFTGTMSLQDMYDTIPGNAFLLKLDSQLNQQWCKLYYDTALTDLTGIIQLPNGDYIVSGYSDQFSWEGNWILMRTDSLGVIKWCKRTVGASEAVGRGHYIAFSPIDSTLVIAYESDSPLLPCSDVSLAKVDLNGNLIWHRLQGDACSDNPGNLFIKSNGNIQLQVNSMLRELDSNGNVISALFHPFGAQTSIGIIKTYDGGFISGGTVYDNMNVNNMCIIKSDSNFFTQCTNQSFTNLFSLPTGVSLTDYVLNDSLAIITENLITWFVADSVPVKVNLCGNILVNEITNPITINLYPNPCHNFIYIQSPYKITHLVIYDFLGQKLFENDINQFNPSLNIEYLKSNKIYQLQLTTENEKIANLKILKL